MYNLGSVQGAEVAHGKISGIDIKIFVYVKGCCSAVDFIFASATNRRISGMGVKSIGKTRVVVLFMVLFLCPKTCFLSFF